MKRTFAALALALFAASVTYAADPAPAKPAKAAKKEADTKVKTVYLTAEEAGPDGKVQGEFAGERMRPDQQQKQRDGGADSRQAPQQWVARRQPQDCQRDQREQAPVEQGEAA